MNPSNYERRGTVSHHVTHSDAGYQVHVHAEGYATKDKDGQHVWPKGAPAPTVSEAYANAAALAAALGVVLR